MKLLQQTSIIKKICIIIIIFALSFQLLPTTVLAQEGSTLNSSSTQIQNNFIELTAIPPRLGEDRSLHGQPGQTIQTTIKVRNTSLEPQTVETFVEDYIIGEDGTTPIPVEEEVTNRWSMKQWLTVSPTRYSLQPNETKALNLLIEIPEDAFPGGRYAMIMHKPVNEFGEALGAASGTQQLVGTLLYLTIDGPINEEAYIRNTYAPQFSEFGPIPVSFDIDNRSDIHIRPNIQIELQNMLGQTSEVIQVMPVKNIFPYTTRTYNTEWQKIWGFGRYTAIITANYGSQGQITSKVIRFWIIPIKLILAFLVIIATFIVTIILIRRYLHHRNDINAQKIDMLEQKLSQYEKGKQFEDETVV